MREYSEYDIQAENFLAKYKAKMLIELDDVVDRFPGDDKATGERYKYKVRLSTRGHSYTFPFYDSIMNYRMNEEPTPYSILACLTSYPIYGDVLDFAEEFGYNISSKEEYKRVEKIYKACKKEYNSLYRLFGDEGMEDLQGIS